MQDIQNSEMIFERLQREKREAAICPAIVESLAKVRSNRLKVQEMRTVAEQRLIELPSLIATNIKKFESVSPEDIPALSRERTGLEAEQAALTAQVADISGHIVSSLDKEEKALKVTLADAAKAFLRVQHKIILQELYEVLFDRAEPIIEGWQKYYDAYSREYGFPVDIYTRRLLRELEIYSTLLDKAIDGGLRRDLIDQATIYKNSIKMPVSVSDPVL